MNHLDIHNEAKSIILQKNVALVSFPRYPQTTNRILHLAGIYALKKTEKEKVRPKEKNFNNSINTDRCFSNSERKKKGRDSTGQR